MMDLKDRLSASDLGHALFGGVLAFMALDNFHNMDGSGIHYRFSPQLGGTRNKIEIKGVNQPALDAFSSRAVSEMAEAKFGVPLDDEIASEIDGLVDECADLGASHSEIVEAILTAYLESDDEPDSRVRELIIRRRKDTL